MKGSRSQPPLNCRGVATIKVLVTIPALLMFSWFALEIGLALRAYNHAKIAADAIGLAAAARYRDGFAASVDDALDAAAANRAPSGPVQIQIGNPPAGGGDVEFGRWDEATRTFVPDAQGGPAVRVTIRFAADHPNGVPGFALPGLFTPSAFAIVRSSVAVYTPPKHITSLLVTGAAAPTVSLADAANLITRGGVAVSCDGDFAISVGGTARVETAVLRVEGLVDSGTESAISGSIETQPAVADDPFAAFPLPGLDPGLASAITHDDIGTTLVAPGVHSGLQAMGGIVVLQPGLHQFAGPISLSGNARLELDSATIQLADGFGIEVLGQASIAGRPSNDIGDWSGHWLIQRSPAIFLLDGDATVDMPADLYGPGLAIDARGTSLLATDASIVGAVAMTGQAEIRCDGSIAPLVTATVPGRARLVR